MLYAILCYNNEDEVFGWSQAEDDAVMARLNVVHERLVREGRFGPAARLMPSTAATTLRKDTDPPIVMDGPFAETKEQLLGFYVVEFASLDEALETVKEMGRANPGGAYEVRPLRLFIPGVGLQ